MEDFLTGKKHVHFIGIGGSGMYSPADTSQQGLLSYRLGQ